MSRNQKNVLTWLILLSHIAGQLIQPFSAWPDTLRPTIEQKTEAGLEQILQAAGSEEVVFRSSDQLRVEGSQNVPKPAAETRSDRDWFLATATPLSDWKLELVYHPVDISQCAFGHGIRWGFNYVHSPSNQRIVLGQDEMVSFALMTESKKDDLKREFEGKVKEANDRHPALVPALPLIHEQLNHLLSTPSLQSEEDQLKLKALSRIAQVEGYQRRVNVFDQKIIHEGRIIPIAPEDVERILGVLGELAATGQVQLEKSRIIQTELQRLRREIAVAVKQAQNGDPSGWDRMAARYSYLLENLSTFSIKIAALLRFVAVVQAHPAVQGKDPKDLKRWGSFGGGPWVLLRAALRIRKPLLAAGIDVLGTEQHNFDFTTSMPAEGEKALAAQAQVPVHQSYQVDIVNDPIPLADGSLDVAEIGILGTLGEESNQAGIPKKIHLLLELNRVVEENGYLFIDVKNKPLPRVFQIALERDFGFKVISDRVEHLGYDKAVLDQIAQGDPRKAEKLREHLRGGSVVVAVKIRTINRDEILKSKENIAKRLRYDDSLEAQERSGYIRTEASQPEEVDLSGLDYDQAQVAIPKTPVISGIPKEEILAKIPRFEDHLDQLERYRLLLPRRRVADRGLIQEEVQRLLSQWHNPELATFDESDAVWLEQVYREQIAAKMFDRYPATRVLEAFPNLESQINELKTAKWDPLAEDFSAAVVARNPLTLVQLDSHFDRYQEHLGMSFAQADRWYRQKYHPQSPYQMIPTTLRGHLLIVNAYAEAGEEKARLSRYLSRFQDAQARWLPTELAKVHGDYLAAMQRDAEWEASYSRMAARRQIWPLKTLARLFNERREGNRALDPASVQADGFRGAVKRAVKLFPVDRWDGLLMVMGLSEAEIKVVHFKAYQRGIRKTAAAQGKQVWPDEKVAELVWQRFSDGESLLPGSVASAGGQGAVVAAKNSYGSWLKALAKILGISEEEVEEILEEDRGKVQRAATAKVAATKGTQVWPKEEIETLILQREIEAEPLYPNALNLAGFSGAVIAANREYDKGWPEAISVVLGITLEQAETRIDEEQRQSRGAGRQAAGLKDTFYNKGVIRQVIRQRREQSKTLLPTPTAQDGNAGIVEAARREYARGWPEAISDALGVTIEWAKEYLEQGAFEARQEIALQRGDRVWTKDSIREAIIHRHRVEQKPLFARALSADLGGIVESIKRNWETLEDGLADILGIPKKEVEKLLEAQKDQGYSQRAREAAKTKGLKLWPKEEIEKLILDRNEKGQGLYVKAVNETDGGAVSAARQIWPGRGPGGSWQNAVADVLVRARKFSSAEEVKRFLRQQKRERYHAAIGKTERRLWSKEAIERLILERYEKKEGLYERAIPKADSGAVKASPHFWSGDTLTKTWENAVEDVLVRAGKLSSSEEVRRLLEEQRQDAYSRRGRRKSQSEAGLEESTLRVVAVSVATAEAEAAERTGAVVVDASELERVPELVPVIRQFRRFADRLILLGESDVAEESARRLAKQGRKVQYVPERNPDAVTTALERIGGRGLGGVSFFGPDETATPVRTAAAVLGLNFERPDVSIEMILRGFGVDPELAAELAAQIDETLGLAHEA